MVINATNPSQAEQQAIAYLRSPQSIRDRCEQLFDLACHDQLRYFRCDLSQLKPTADFVLQVMQANYPDLNVPFHSRWRHFDVGGVMRVAQLQQQLAPLSAMEQARAKFDLAIASVLLDAGAGAEWQYVEAETSQVFRRSEGLAVASFHMFVQGLFSSDPHHPLQVDALGLQKLTETDLAQGFQVTTENPLVGSQGRLNLLHQLGRVLHSQPQRFGEACPRPGYLVDYLIEPASLIDSKQALPASTVFAAVLQGLSEIWAGRVAIAGVNLGDVWTHSALPDTAIGSQLVPFHKLSQWITYSLLEPLQELGIEIIGLDQLTGLAEYRNGGLCVDMGLIQPKVLEVTTQSHLPGSEMIVEWRALTVMLLDAIANTLRQQLNLTPLELPLVKILEGGTWAAGRQIARDRRPGGIPPIQIQSDGTVF